MKLSSLFRITAIFSFLNGVFYLFTPEFSVSILGRSTDAVGILNMRYFGAAALGIGYISWFGQKTRSWEFQRVIAIGVLIILSISAVVGLIGTLSGAVNEFGWLFVGADSLLSIGFSLILIKRRGIV